MVGFATKINLYNESLHIKELKLKHFKTLLKVLINDNNIEDTYYNLVNIIADIISRDSKEVEKLSVIDFLLIVLYLRAISIGGDIQLEIEGEANKRINLNINKVIETLTTCFKIEFKQIIQNIEITYKQPSIKDYLFLQDDLSDLLFLKKYIKKIHINNFQSINIDELDNSTFLQFFETLPANYSASILKYVSRLITELNSINLFKHFSDENFSLFLSPENFIFILQLLFSKNLLPLYENIFALCKFTNLTPEYLEDCTPGEYTIFVKLLERVLKEQTVQQNKNALPPINADNPNFM